MTNDRTFTLLAVPLATVLFLKTTQLVGADEVMVIPPASSTGDIGNDNSEAALEAQARQKRYDECLKNFGDAQSGAGSLEFVRTLCREDWTVDPGQTTAFSPDPLLNDEELMFTPEITG